MELKIARCIIPKKWGMYSGTYVRVARRRLLHVYQNTIHMF